MEHLLKIIHLSHSSTQGGAAIAAKRLNDIMFKHLDSSIVTASQLSPFPSCFSMKKNLFLKIYNWFYWKSFHRQTNKYHNIMGTWSAGFGRNKIETIPGFANADAIYLHWINFNMLSIEEIGHLLNMGKPIIWFLHDMWPMTGGCHYSLDCVNYHHHCHNCPLLLSNEKKDWSYYVFERKIHHLAGHPNLTIVTPSQWLASCASNSYLFSHNRIEVIPNVINTESFHPFPQRMARDFLGLPHDKKLILFGCEAGSKNYYKGWKYLDEALQKINLVDKELVIFGQEQDNSLARELKTKIHFLGKLHDEISLTLAYNAADIFISPSIAENFCLTLCEASACGIPCVCFQIGGNPEIVLHKKTGWLAKYKDSCDLANGIEWVLNTPEYSSLAINARKHIKEICSQEIIFNQHMKLLNSLL